MLSEPQTSRPRLRAGGAFDRGSRYLKNKYLIRAAMANNSTRPTSRCPRPIPHIMPPSIMAKVPSLEQLARRFS